MSSCSRSSLMERASSMASEARVKPVAAPASMRGTSQRAASFLSTPSAAAWSVTSRTRAIGSSVSSNVRTSAQASPTSGKSRLLNITGSLVSSQGT